MVDKMGAHVQFARYTGAPWCGYCGAMTQSEKMSRRGGWPSIAVLLFGFLPISAQSLPEETLKVYTEHPRLFLNAHRLKLLQREKERRSMRWQQFELLMAGHAPMPEPGFAAALYYRAGQEQDSGRRAVAWSLSSGSEARSGGDPRPDLRQLALIFDWCQDLLTPAQSRALALKLQKGIEQSQNDRSVAAARSR